MIATIILASAFSCTTVGNRTICREVDSFSASQSVLIIALQRKCMARVPALQREKYPGGVTGLMKDCEKEAKTEAETSMGNAMRNVDQNGVQR